jgi:hypothetical protein
VSRIEQAVAAHESTRIERDAVDGSSFLLQSAVELA